MVVLIYHVSKNTLNSLSHIVDPHIATVTSLSDIFVKIALDTTPSSFKIGGLTD